VSDIRPETSTAATARTTHQPRRRPQRPFFSSGPCAKRPGWTPEALAGAPLGRSHRSATGKGKLEQAIERTRAVLGLGSEWRIGIVPASDTGAVEMALWSLLGARGVDLFAWESFGKGWVTDVVTQLRLEDARVFEAPYGELPDLGQWDPARDAVLCWNGTTSGVRVPDGSWIPDDRQGLVICDATSAAFAQPLPWERLDVVTYSWQKVLGGEAAHGMLLLAPRAVERLQSYTPPWPLPKIFRLMKKGELNEGLFEGKTINTPSLLCVEDYLDALAWVESLGGVDAVHARADANFAAVERWVDRTPWVDFLAADPRTRSNTSVCLKIVDPRVAERSEAEQAAIPKQISALLEREGVAFDVNGYRDAPPGLRIWCGGTVETADVEAALPWLDWAYGAVVSTSFG